VLEDAFALYEDSLIASWRQLASVDPEGEVIDDSDSVTMSHSHPALRNALLRSPKGLDRIQEVFGGHHHAVWVREPGGSLEKAGYRRDERTVPMVLDLASWDRTPAVPVVRVAPGDVARRSGVDRAVLAGLQSAYGHATERWESWALTMTTGVVANVSFVATREEFQRRGLGRAVVTRALLDARHRGERYATLQSTTAGLSLYRGLGFRNIGVWQEWIPVRSAP